MKLTVDRSALLKALSHASRIVDSRPTVPILNTVALAAEGDRLTIRATDTEMQAVTSCAAAVEASGALAVPLRNLVDLAKSWPDGSAITLTERPEEGRVRVACGRSRVDLPTFPVEDLPDLDAAQSISNHRFAMPGATLAKMLGAVVFAASTDVGGQGFLCGVHLHHKPETGGLRAVATNRKRLARYEAPAPDGAEGMPGIILGRKAVAEIVKLGEAVGESLVELAVSERAARLTSNGTTILTRLLEGAFPAYDAIFAFPVLQRAVVGGDAFRAALNRALIIGGERQRSVSCVVSEGRISILADDPDNGQVDEDLDAETEGQDRTVAFPAKQGVEIVDAFDADTIELSFSEVGRPFLWRNVADPALLCALSPVATAG